ncbi:hypothetical protein SADUNF_Sadunf09G0036300 [Salix dunnii]|uniref:Large ribosomal subunit protein uL16m n=1 Tax=Salix dunnii TaxID=1413687 RepID=A0A835JSU6_9ROSI|nr:hypothetical protein SADUNF_Sadunf09G0036300 [Salix dunnii]
MASAHGVSSHTGERESLAIKKENQPLFDLENSAGKDALLPGSVKASRSSPQTGSLFNNERQILDLLARLRIFEKVLVLKKVNLGIFKSYMLNTGPFFRNLRCARLEIAKSPQPKRGDVLYPKRTKYSKNRKGRCRRGCKPDGTQLGFGRYGTKSCRAGRLSYRAIEAARRAIIGQFRRNGKIWVRVLADLPITRKPIEIRMGRGKGNNTGWIARVSTGQILFEMDGVSLSNARQAATLAAHKPCSSTKFVQWS